jgi:hypothetical protein
VVSSRTQDVALPVVMPESRARLVAEALLHDAWAAREGLDLALPPSELSLDAGDVVRLSAGSADTFRLTEIADGDAPNARGARGRKPLCRRGCTAPSPLTRLRPGARPSRNGVLRRCAAARRRQRMGGLHRGLSQALAGRHRVLPLAGQLRLLLDTVLTAPAGMGQLAFDFWSGPTWRWDRGNELWVDLFSGTLASADELAVLGGANAIAVENAHGEWEIVQFATAELVSAGRYKLTNCCAASGGRSMPWPARSRRAPGFWC